MVADSWRDCAAATSTYALLGAALLDDMTDHLVARLQNLLTERPSRRPLCVLLGAGATVPFVPGVAELTQRALQLADKPGGATLASLSRPVGRSGGTQKGRITGYSDALKLVKVVRGFEGVRAFIQASVLSAYDGELPPGLPVRPLSEAEFRNAEEDLGSWRLPEGLRALATVVKSHNDRFCRYLLTTNFDPLFEIALRRAELDVHAFAADHDSTPGSLRLRPADLLVLHLHGDCRGETLHSPETIQRPRSALERWLGSHLQGTTLLVVGYSGWDDVVGRALRRELDERGTFGPNAAPEVLWAVYEDESTHDYVNPSLAEFFRDNPNRVTPYYGIDRDLLFSRLEDSLRPRRAVRPLQPTSTFRDLVTNLSTNYRFGLGGMSFTENPDFVFWPHRLRKPHLIHGVHALAAVTLGRLDVPVELHLDDTDLPEATADILATEFREAVRAWFSVCGVEEPPVIFRLSELLRSASEPDLSARLWRLTSDFYASTTTAFDALKGAKVIDPEKDGIPISVSSSARRLLRPVSTWLALEEALERHRPSEGTNALALTLGGADEKPMWDLWRRRANVPSVVSVYVPRLDTADTGPDLWRTHELHRDALSREGDLTQFMRRAGGQSGQAESILWWFDTLGVRLAELASEGRIGRPSVYGRELNSFSETLTSFQNDPAATVSELAASISKWLHAGTGVV